MQKLDALIIGGGPAGLTAAIYLARFRRRVIVADKGRGRAALIPKSYNYPGSADGISGKDLLCRLRRQGEQYGALIVDEEVVDLEKQGSNFSARLDNGANFESCAVILATGIRDKKPALPHMADFIYEGAIRFCPICDAYEATGKQIAVIGFVDDALEKVLFLRTYTPHVTLLPLDRQIRLNAGQVSRLRRAGIEVPLTSVADLIAEGNNIRVIRTNGASETFDVIYPAMGAEVMSRLAVKLGAACDEKGHLHTDAHQRTSVPNLYAIGDITTDLHQISVATGQAAIAACAVHNCLPENYMPMRPQTARAQARSAGRQAYRVRQPQRRKTRASG